MDKETNNFDMLVERILRQQRLLSGLVTSSSVVIGLLAVAQLPQFSNGFRSLLMVSCVTSASFAVYYVYFRYRRHPLKEVLDLLKFERKGSVFHLKALLTLPLCLVLFYGYYKTTTHGSEWGIFLFSFGIFLLYKLIAEVAQRRIIHENQEKVWATMSETRRKIINDHVGEQDRMYREFQTFYETSVRPTLDEAHRQVREFKRMRRRMILQSVFRKLHPLRITLGLTTRLERLEAKAYLAKRKRELLEEKAKLADTKEISAVDNVQTSRPAPTKKV